MKWKLLLTLVVLVVAGLMTLGMMEPALIQHDAEIPLGADLFKQKS